MRTVLGIVKAVEVTGRRQVERVKLGATESSSSSSESDSISYHGSSSSSVRSLATDSLESGGEESSD